MKVASALDLDFMVQYLLIFLIDSARLWLDHLKEGTIRCWRDLEQAFYNHFEGACTKPGST
jgi:hypothetical protein